MRPSDIFRWKDGRKFLLPGLLLGASLVFFLLSLTERMKTRDITRVTQQVSSRIESALNQLDAAAQAGGPVRDLPEDMSIYRYENDSLVYWRHTLPVINDNISPDFIPGKLSPRHYGGYTPICGITEDYRFVTIGSKWYIARLVTTRKGSTTLAALYISDALSDGGKRKVSPRLHLPANCFISDIPQDIGCPVEYGGQTLMFIGSRPQDSVAVLADSAGKWLGLACLALFFVLLLRFRPTPGIGALSITAITLCYLTARYWGSLISTGLLFSPQIYADGPVWSSFGAMMLHNMYLFLLTVCLYLMRKDLARRVRGSRRATVLLSAFVILCIIGLTAYFIAGSLSFLENSSIPVTLGQKGPGAPFRFISSLIFTLLFASIVMLLYILGSLIMGTTDSRLPVPSIRLCILLSVILSLGAHFILARVSLKKEQERTEMWAERLSMERDLMLEMQLRAIEGNLATDPYFALLSSAEGGEDLIRSRITDHYFADIPRKYRTNIRLYQRKDGPTVRQRLARVYNNDPIAPGSLFHWECDENGSLHYDAVIRMDNGTFLSIGLESAPGSERYSYRGLLASKEAATVYTPDIYSYAKYIDNHLVAYKGTFPYVTLMEETYSSLGTDGQDIVRNNGWIHFFNRTGGNETIVISRKQTGILPFLSGFLLRMMLILIVLLLPVRTIKRKRRKLNSFTRRIGRTVVMGIAISLACIVFISLRFVIDSGIREREENFSERINTVQALLEKACANASSAGELRSGRMKDALAEASMMSKSDISLFSPQGKLFLSTVPDIYDEMRLSSRIEEKPYYEITYLHRRFCRQEEQLDGMRYTLLYTPVFNRFGETVCLAAVICPDTQDLLSEAIPHAILLISVSLLLLLISQGLIYKFTDKVFKPIERISQKMKMTDITELEHIEYEADDEIAALIKAYNRMVDMIESSAKVMAGKERDKAWSEMARQVAHEIKNPLTPIKLDLQRLIRLKASGKSEWSDKFDELSRIILENIDVLTETANDFSSFAKLYTQEPVEFDLDRTLSDQISLFDNKDHIEISYVGLKDTVIHGPKPQLIRVIVNLVTNSVQSIENAGMERGRILVCLRKAAQEGMLDITVEDNGPGVAEENIGKLFTPNFTTKTGGAGIGLAMCRNIVQMCDGRIAYSRSFTLGGACFTVTLPER